MPRCAISSSVWKSLGIESATLRPVAPNYAHPSLRTQFANLCNEQLVVLHLIDSFVLTQPSLYISALLLALRSMLQMDLPHLNVLTKIDNLNMYPDLPFNLDFYTEVQDLDYLLPHLDAERGLAP